jgi:hypothetical protein
MVPGKLPQKVAKIQPLNLAPAELVENHVCIHFDILPRMANGVNLPIKSSGIIFGWFYIAWYWI